MESLVKVCVDKMNIEDIGYMFLGGIIVLFFTYTSWHPNNNDYVDRVEYDKSYQDYQKQLKKN